MPSLETAVPWGPLITGHLKPFDRLAGIVSSMVPWISIRAMGDFGGCV